MPVLPKLYQNIEEEGTLPKLFSEASVTLIPEPDKGTTRKKKLQASVPDEHTCKNPWQTENNWIYQYIERITPCDQVGFIPEIEGCFSIHNQCDRPH